MFVKKHPLCVAHVPARRKLVTVYINGDGGADCTFYAEVAGVVKGCKNRQFAEGALKKGVREVWLAIDDGAQEMISYR